MKRIKNAILYTLSVIFSISCSSQKAFPIKEGNDKDTYIDRINYPYLYIDSKPETKFYFINTLGTEEGFDDISNQWIQIEQLKNKFYFHLSFGQGGINKFIISGDNFYEIIASGDNPEGTPILKFTKKSKTEFAYTIQNRISDIKKERVIKFYVIDIENQIAIVEDLDGMVPYRFMLAGQEKYNIPVLINYYKERRLADFADFDNVNFEKLLKEKGFK